MKYVLDASVAVKWVLPEADSPRAIALRDDYLRAVHELLAPDFLPAEVAHALARAERRRIIVPPEGAKRLADILANVPLLHPYLPLLPRAYEIASTMRAGVYDCVYVALAEQEHCELVTADDKLVKNLGTHFPFIRELAAMP